MHNLACMVYFYIFIGLRAMLEVRDQQQRVTKNTTRTAQHQHPRVGLGAEGQPLRVVPLAADQLNPHYMIMTKNFLWRAMNIIPLIGKPNINAFICVTKGPD